MKKYLKFLMLLPFVTLFAACDLGDSEPVGKYAFETDAQKILIEAKLPNGVYDADDIYICGPFNGAEPESYVADAKWRLTQSSININIFGVYLDPNDFVEGTSLGDGFWFYSANSGLSLTTKKELATFTSNAGAGQRTSIVVSQWGEPVSNEVETLPEHSGTIRVYVDNQIGWETVRLYMYGTENNLGGGWPGAEVTGTETISGVDYLYFEYAVADVEGKEEHLIFNDGNGTQIPGDQEPVITFSADVVDYFFKVFGEKQCEAIDNPIKPVITMPEHDNSVRVYIDNQSGWEAVMLYMYGTENNLGGGWPGAAATGTETIGDVDYIYFEYAIADVDGKEEHLIFNDGNGTQIAKEQEPIITFSADVVDYAFLLNADLQCIAIDPTDRSADEVPAPETPETPETPEEPETPAEPVAVTFFIQNNTGYAATYIYAWGASEVFGSWPGTQLENFVTLGGVPYARIDVEAEAYELGYNPIMNNNNGTQYDCPAVTSARYNFIIAGETAAELGAAPDVKIYVDDQTGWEAIALYSWGDGEAFGGWPGGTYATETVDGKEYKVFTVPAASFGGSCNLIFNNNGGGTQLSDYKVRADRDYFLTVTAEGVTPIE